MRRTIARRAEIVGRGLHTGTEVRLRLSPAEAGTGIVFTRSDLAGLPPIPARIERVVATERRTSIGTDGARVETVEHLLAAAYALEIDDLSVDVTGPELPIMDGSFAPFVRLLDDAGWAEQQGRVDRLVIDHDLTVEDDMARYHVAPAEVLSLDVVLAYQAPVIGRQRAVCTVTAEAFRRDLAGARTFGFLNEVAGLKARGLLAGGTAECAIVLSDDAVLNTTLRWPTEFARHKAGDLLGDLALLGARLAMRITASRPSHRGNIACARAIAAAARLLEA